MNSDKLSEAMKRLAKMLEDQAQNERQCDRLCQASDALDDLKRRLGMCKRSGSCKQGNCQGCGSCSSFVKRSNKKGGLKAGWGTADQWKGGSLTPGEDQRMPTLVQAKEQSGRSTSYTVVSKDERAESTLAYKDVFAEMVQKAEADLSLETVPIAYRDFLRRYFMAIRPAEEDDAEE